MSNKLDQIRRLGGATKVIPKQVEVTGLAEVAAAIRDMAESQQRAQQVFISVLSELVAAIQEKQVNSTDLGPLVDAIASLKQEPVTESNTLVDYEIEVVRDQRALAKTYRFTAHPQTTH